MAEATPTTTSEPEAVVVPAKEKETSASGLPSALDLLNDSSKPTYVETKKSKKFDCVFRCLVHEYTSWF